MIPLKCMWFIFPTLSIGSGGCYYMYMFWMQLLPHPWNHFWWFQMMMYGSFIHIFIRLGFLVKITRWFPDMYPYFFFDPYDFVTNVFPRCHTTDCNLSQWNHHTRFASIIYLVLSLVSVFISPFVFLFLQMPTNCRPFCFILILCLIVVKPIYFFASLGCLWGSW